MAMTRPSIMSDGATMSAPASAWERASFARSSRVPSLSTSPSLMMPQWPWSVYSHMQTSVMTASPGTCFFSARMVSWMMPCSA